MTGSTQRFVIAALSFLLLLAVGTALYLYMRDRPPSPLPPQATLNDAQENAVDPYRAEMGCIDQVLQRRDLEANQAQAMLNSCRGPDSGTNAANETDAASTANQSEGP